MQSSLSAPSSSSCSWSLSEDRPLRMGAADSSCLRRQTEEMMKIVAEQTVCHQGKVYVCVHTPLPESRGGVGRWVRPLSELPEPLSHTDRQLWSESPHKDTADDQKPLKIQHDCWGNCLQTHFAAHFLQQPRVRMVLIRRLIRSKFSTVAVTLVQKFWFGPLPSWSGVCKCFCRLYVFA